MTSSSRPIRVAAVAFAVLGLVVGTRGFSTYLALHAISPASWGARIYDVPAAAVAAIAAVLLARHMAAVPPRHWPWPIYPVAGYVAWAMLSATWAVSSITTLQALIGIGIAAFGCWFGWVLDGREQIWSVALATSIVTVASAVVIAFYPEYGKMPPLRPGGPGGGEWQGIFGNRNSLAPLCALGLLGLAGVWMLRPSLRRALLLAPLALLQLVVLRGSKGATSVLALLLVAVTAGVLVGVQWLRRRGVGGKVVAGSAAAITTGAILLAMANVGWLAANLGRDITLSQRRSVIWPDVREAIAVHPVRGYGFWAFWDNAELTAATYARHGTAYASAHNSILEVTLGLGVVGLVLYLAMHVGPIVGIASRNWRAPDAVSVWWAFVFVFLVAHNLTESFVLWHSYNWMLFVAAGFVGHAAAAAAAGRASERRY